MPWNWPLVFAVLALVLFCARASARRSALSPAKGSDALSSGVLESGPVYWPGVKLMGGMSFPLGLARVSLNVVECD